MTLVNPADVALPLGSGDWTAVLVDRATGAELPLERTGWRATAARAENAVSEASVVLDPEYADRLRRRPRLWLDEIHLWRGDLLSWVGPVTGIDDAAEGEVVWNCQDRMAIIVNRRWFWASATYTGDVATLMDLALDAGDRGDPSGLIRDPVPTGVVSDLSVVAGDKIGQALRQLGVSWTVAADVVRFGDIYDDTGLELPPSAWGPDRPTLEADGFRRLSHVCAVTDDDHRVFYPSPDPDDREPGSPLLVDTIDVGDVSLRAARELARAAWVSRQGALSIIPDEARPVGPQFPLAWPYLVPGLVLTSSSDGAQLTADQLPVKLTNVTVDIADSAETSVLVAIDEAPQADLVDPFLANIVETSIGSLFPSGQVYPGADPYRVDWEEIGFDPEIDPLPPDGGIDWEVVDPLPDLVSPIPVTDPLPWPDPDIPTDQDPFPDPVVQDPFAGCPPAFCCDQCDFTSTDPDTTDSIWLCTDLDPGDTTWTSVAGDTRNLQDQAPDNTTDGGVCMTPTSLVSPSTIFPADANWNATGDITWVIEMSHWWSVPNGRLEHNQMELISSGQWGSNGAERLDGTNPNPWGITQNNGAGSDWIDVDPATVGASGYAKLFLRIVNNPATGAISVDLSTDGTTWVNQGSAVWGAPSSLTTTVSLNWDATPSGGNPTDLGPSIIHSLQMSQAGGNSYSFDQADIEALGQLYTANTRGPATTDMGQLSISGGSAAASNHALVANGAPVYCHWVGGIRDSTAQPIFDGADLDDPAIAVAWAEDPSYIQVITGVQPSAFNGVDSSYGSAQVTQHALVHAVCDRAGFSDLDANGWPDGWFPFGTRTS